MPEAPTVVYNLVVRAVHAYAQAGQYTVTVSARNAVGQVQAALQVDIVGIDDYSLLLPLITR
jgi:PKD repeat protein